MPSFLLSPLSLFKPSFSPLFIAICISVHSFSLTPREAFDREKLKELADTVSEIGVLQPIVVRPKGNRYEIIAGERRWKASQIAGKREIPAIVKDIPDEEVMVESLIEQPWRTFCCFLKGSWLY